MGLYDYLKRYSFISLFSLFPFLGGCMLGPDYQRPEMPLPNKWTIDIPQAAAAANLKWWEQFDDLQLNDLIRTALAENKDLQIAAARIDQFLSLYGVTRSDLFPQLDADASYQRFSNSQLIQPAFPSMIANDFAASLRVGWELDIWGRIRRLSESAWADYLGQESARRAVILTLVSSVAETYARLRLADRELEITLGTIANRKEWENFARTRFEGGIVSELDLVQAQQELARTEADLPVFERQVLELQNLLSFLLGRSPNDISRGRTIDQLANHSEVPGGVPSEVLDGRPDVAQAEQALISANARIGAARADYFPRLTLTGLFGFESEDLSDLFKKRAQVWNYGPNLTVPIFTAGRIGSQVDVAEAATREALYQYQQVILSALKEVSDALAAYRTSLDLRAARDRQVTVSQRYLYLARERYNEGQTTYLEVLDAQRSLFLSELAQAESQGQKVLALVDLFRSTGGGWVSEAEQYNPSIPKPLLLSASAK